jgi:hypothetical protein
MNILLSLASLPSLPLFLNSHALNLVPRFSLHHLSRGDFFGTSEAEISAVFGMHACGTEHQRWMLGVQSYFNWLVWRIVRYIEFNQLIS